MERQLNIELQAMNETLMAQIADHRRDVEGLNRAISDLEAKLVAEGLRRQAEEESKLNCAKQVAALREELEAARATAQRAPLESETVCHACDGSGWVERGW